MDVLMVERRAQCPYCGERIWLMLDLSAGRQAYTEDCQVCCQPMLVIFDVEDGEAVELRVERGS